MADYSNETWIEQATGLDITFGPVQEETRSVVISVGPTVHEDRVFRVYHVPAVAGSNLFDSGATWDESAITGYIDAGILLPHP